MEIRNFRLSPIVIGVALSLGTFSTNAALRIITDADRQVVTNTHINEQVTHNFLAPRDLAGSIITASFADMPLIVVLSHIVPNNFALDVDSDIEGEIVSWEGSKRWDGVLRDLSEAYGLLVHVTKDPNKVTIVGTGSTTEITPTLVAPTTDVQSVVKCDTSNCDSGVVDIEKLVLDTSWATVDVDAQKLVFKSPEENSDELTAEDIEAQELAEEESKIAQKGEKLDVMRQHYEDAYVRHGRGTFEEFVNGGAGESLKGNLNPKAPYTYVYKQGTLFTSIDEWAKANGYTVKNDILTEYKKDYPNYTDVHLYGDFFSVTSALLNKYGNAEVPINHKYYTQGKVLHIFVGKYN